MKNNEFCVFYNIETFFTLMGYQCAVDCELEILHRNVDLLNTMVLLVPFKLVETFQLLISFTWLVFPGISCVRLLRRFSTWDWAGRIEIQELTSSERTEEHTQQYSIAKAIAIEKMAMG